MSPKPLLPPRFEQCSAARLAGIRGVLTDIDDTLTRAGAIEPVALAALQRLREARLPTIAITGRPMGWSEPFARRWPIDAIVAENGAVALFMQDGVLQVEYAQDAATRQRNRIRLDAAAARVQRELPHARLARDSAGRATDIAIDHAEFERLDPQDIERVVAILRDLGLSATVSSIHVNAWFGEHDKGSGARWIVPRLFGRALDPREWIYVGDSANDQVMFAMFPLSVGVANLVEVAGSLHTWPAYLTRGERGAGFAEVAEALIAARHA